MKLQDHLHYTDFEWSINAKKNTNPSAQKIVDTEEKANGNNVDSQEQIRQVTSNENMIDYYQFTMSYAKLDGMLWNCRRI